MKDEDVGKELPFKELIPSREAGETEARLSESVMGYRTIVESARDVIFTLSSNGTITSLNPAFETITGWSRADWLGKPFPSVLHPDDLKSAMDFFLSVLNGEKPPIHELRVSTKSGEYVVGEFQANPLHIQNGRVVSVLGIARDITERKQAEEALRTERLRFRSLSESAPFGMVMVDSKGIFKYINPKFKELFGYGLDDVPDGKTWFRKAYPDPIYRHNAISAWVDDLNGFSKGERRQRIFKVTCKDEMEKIVRFISVQLENGENLMTCEDMTDLNRTEKEKATLEEQLRQSQKAEAIGRLAGGIAHDFNNLLAIIQGYTEISLLTLRKDDPLRKDIEEIKRAGERGAELVRHLLAFSRRQVMQMKVIDLNALLRNLEKMLCRVIGEDIELVTILTEDLGKVKADPGQIEQILLNLAVNARDAMPFGGKLTIKMANAELEEEYARIHIGLAPGRYVMISVSDTGVGMAPKVKERLFEPFFTTKERGKGTGLGLSTVYGIVKQSGGNIWVDSDPGQGTTFSILLPMVDKPLEEPGEKASEGKSPHGSETILVVEDEEEVRKLTAQILKGLGYELLEASQGNEALLVCKQHKGPIHLLVTDVVMPGMNGPELAKRLESLQPNMKVLYMSGYANSITVHHGVLKRGTNYIQKPFRVEGLAKKVREMLDKDSNPTA